MRGSISYLLSIQKNLNRYGYKHQHSNRDSTTYKKLKLHIYLFFKKKERIIYYYYYNYNNVHCLWFLQLVPVLIFQPGITVSPTLISIQAAQPLSHCLSFNTLYMIPLIHSQFEIENQREERHGVGEGEVEPSC